MLVIRVLRDSTSISEVVFTIEKAVLLMYGVEELTSIVNDFWVTNTRNISIYLNILSKYYAKVELKYQESSSVIYYVPSTSYEFSQSITKKRWNKWLIKYKHNSDFKNRLDKLLDY